jgi:hypothetical protein
VTLGCSGLAVGIVEQLNDDSKAVQPQRAQSHHLLCITTDAAAGGPKMRKWYGQESNSGVPRDGGEQPEEQRQLQVCMIGWHELAWAS